MNVNSETKTMREKVVALSPPPAPSMPPPIDLDRLADLLAARMNVDDRIVQAATNAARGTAIGVFYAVASLLAVRVLLLLGLVGGFVLAWMALKIDTPQAVGVLIAYAILIMIPLVYLERTKPTARVD